MVSVKHTLVLVVLLVVITHLQGQKIILPLKERAEDSQYGKLMMVTPVFGFHKDSVANPLDVSAGSNKNPIIWKKVVLPVLIKDTTMGIHGFSMGRRRKTLGPIIH